MAKTEIFASASSGDRASLKKITEVKTRMTLAACGGVFTLTVVPAAVVYAIYVVISNLMTVVPTWPVFVGV